ncbi:MAG: MOSC N-terminal beta barrel domain-containing protein [Chloroflexi bacterium]|nr:MOSC N-terminal beta barrel domain-containing protein [Chloroflexota bacterium]
MPSTTETVVGSVDALWRYPVKSMQGEEVEESEVGPRGLAGDRAYALFEPEVYLARDADADAAPVIIHVSGTFGDVYLA